MKKMIFILLVIILVQVKVSAQCSDAGICSLGGNSHAQKADNIISVLYSYGTSGKGDDLKFNSIKVSTRFRVFEEVDLDLSLPYNFIDGPMGSVNGVGDLLVNLKRNVQTSLSSSIGLSVGMKLATGKTNEKNLPQSYQSGLGTNDILFGVDYSINNFSIGVGYQISSGRSDNGTDRLRRGDDFLVRAGYTKIFENDFLVGAELLIIKRMQESSVLTTGNIISGAEFVDVDGSDQLQVNLLGKILKSVSESLRLEAVVAVPFLKRDVNIDGLKRSFSLSLGAIVSL